MLLDRLHLATLRTALKHYVQRITTLLDNDEDVKLGNTALQEDLHRTIDESNRILEELKQVEDDTRKEFVSASLKEKCRLDKNQRIIHAAFKCYVADLEKSKIVVVAKLGDSKPVFTEVNNEINRCGEIEAECFANLSKA